MTKAQVVKVIDALVVVEEFIAEATREYPEDYVEERRLLDEALEIMEEAYDES